MIMDPRFPCGMTSLKARNVNRIPGSAPQYSSTEPRAAPYLPQSRRLMITWLPESLPFVRYVSPLPRNATLRERTLSS